MKLIMGHFIWKKSGKPFLSTAQFSADAKNLESQSYLE